MTLIRPPPGRLQSVLLTLTLALAPSAYALDGPQIHIESRSAIHDTDPHSAVTVTHALTLSIANIAAWSATEIISAVRQAAQILAQCGIRTQRAELLLIAVPDSHRDFHTPRSRELARVLALPRPTLYFVADTRQTPAFDAEAIGRGNSRNRPELTDTVWIARGTRDLGIVIAHELAHVLMDSGTHNFTAGNLMNETTALQNTELTAAQCTLIKTTGERNGLLHSVN